MLAQLRPAYDGDGRAQFRPAYAAASTDITLIVDVDGGNVDGTSTVVTKTGENATLIEVAFRSAAITGTNGSGWRHGKFAVDDAEDEVITVRWDRSTMTSASTTPTTGFLTLWTQDFENWTQAPSRTLVGGSSGYIECTIGPLPAGLVHIVTQPMGENRHAAEFAEELLTDYSAVAEPVASADENGVVFTTPAETDENSRAIGGNPIHGIKLSWGGATTDGGPKRKLVVLTGIHAAGEHTSWISFMASMRWWLESESAGPSRANWDIYWYGNLSANGIVGGHRRHDFRNAIDKNRDGVNRATAEMAAILAAIEADVGTADAMFDWHGFSTQTSLFIPGTMTAPNQETLDFISIGETIFGVSAVDYFENIPGGMAAFGYNILGAKVAFACEVPQRGSTDPAQYEFIGESWAQTLQEADAQGVFYQAEPVSHVATGALVAQSASISGSATRIGEVAPIVHVATGALAAQAATIAGAAERIPAIISHVATGALVAQAAQVSGQATRIEFIAPTVHVASGNLIAGAARIRGRDMTIITEGGGANEMFSFGRAGAR